MASKLHCDSNDVESAMNCCTHTTDTPTLYAPYSSILLAYEMCHSLLVCHNKVQE